MTKNKSNMSKFLTGAITATLVASAVAPVAASADEIDFTDVDKTSSHYPNIIQAAERGLMTGYEGKFNPLVSMTRGQVVKALGKYIVGQTDVTLDQYLEDNNLLNTVTPFNDVPTNVKDQELFKYSLVVKDAEAFTGNKNNLLPADKITREQMSKVLVGAFNLEEIEGAEANVADMDKVQGQYQDFVTILSQHEITKADNNKFNPKGDVKRQQMASFLNRSYEAVQEDDVKIEEIDSVEAATKTVLQSADVDAVYEENFELTLNYLTADDKIIPTNKLPEDLKVTFSDNKEVFNTDGTIKDAAKIGNVNSEITVVAEVSSESQNLSLTKEFTVNVVAAADYETVTEAVVKNDDVLVGTAVVGDSNLKLIPTKAVQNDGKELDATKEDSPDTVQWNNQVASVTSSNSAILAAEYDATNHNVKLNPIAKGEATVTVLLNSGEKFTKTIAVETVARKATNATATNLNVSTTESAGTIDVVITDQYGDPVKGVLVYGHPTKTGSDKVVTVIQKHTDKEGKASLPVTATGSDTVTVSLNEDAEKEGLATSTVTFAEAGAITSYDLRVATDSESQDGKLDLYNSSKDNLSLQFIGKDAENVVAKVFDQTDVGAKYTVTSSNTDIATVAVGSTGAIDVTPHAVGTATITVKEGSITRATYTVTVENSVPSIQELSIVSGAKFTAKESMTYALDDAAISKLIQVDDFELAYNSTNKVFDVKDGNNKIGYVSLDTSKSNLLTIDADGRTLKTDSSFDSSTVENASVIFSLHKIDGEVIDSAELKLTYDGIAPHAPLFTATEVTASNKNDYTLSGTAEAGSTVAISFSAGGQTADDINVVTDNAGNWTTDSINLNTLLAPIAAGDSITIKVTATDAAGNESDEETAEVTYP